MSKLIVKSQILPRNLHVTYDKNILDIFVTNGIIYQNASLYNCIGRFLQKNDFLRKKFSEKNIIDKVALMNVINENLFNHHRSHVDPMIFFRFAKIFNVGIYLLERGSSIYYFGNEADCSNRNIIFLFLKNDHFYLIVDEISIARLIESFHDPNFVNFIKYDTIHVKHRRKRSEKKDKKYMEKLLGENTNRYDDNFFADWFNSINWRILIERKKNRRGKRKTS